jgi:hypothetical protein
VTANSISDPAATPFADLVLNNGYSFSKYNAYIYLNSAIPNNNSYTIYVDLNNNGAVSINLPTNGTTVLTASGSAIFSAGIGDSLYSRLGSDIGSNTTVALVAVTLA